MLQSVNKSNKSDPQMDMKVDQWRRVDMIKGLKKKINKTAYSVGCIVNKFKSAEKFFDSTGLDKSSS